MKTGVMAKYRSVKVLKPHWVKVAVCIKAEGQSCMLYGRPTVWWIMLAVGGCGLHVSFVAALKETNDAGSTCGFLPKCFFTRFLSTGVLSPSRNVVFFV